MEKHTIKNRMYELGLSEVKPTTEALKKMDISKRRLTTILERKNKAPVTVSELQKISQWINQTIKIADDDLIKMVN